MKRILLFTLISILGLVSCNKQEGGDKNQTPIFKLVSKYNLTFPSEGGTGSVRYTVQYPVEGAQVEYNCQSEWVTDITTADSIVFNVQPNPTSEERVAILTVNYLDQSHNITITQKSNLPDYDIHFEAKAFNSTYYGRQESLGFNYFIILSEYGVTHESGYDYGYKYYRLDLYSDQTGFFDDTLPEGEYIFDNRNTGDPGTIASEFSILLDTSNGDVEQIPFQDGKLTVKDGRIEAILTLSNGQIHYVTYEGPMEPGYPNIDEDAIMSTFNSDVTANVTGGGIDIYYRGDYYGIGCDSWLVNVIEEVDGYSGEYIQFEFLTERSTSGMVADAFLGDYTTYEFPTENFVGTILPGELQNGFHPIHSWYSRCNSGILDNNYRAPLVGGTVTASKSGDTYTFVFDCVDDRGNSISGSFSGTIRYTFDHSVE